MKKLLFVLLTLTACSHADADKALEEARAFSANITNATNVICNDSDSDGDGYVSCTVFRKNEDPLPISCGAERWCVTNCARGCKYTPFPAASKKTSSAN